MLREAAMPIASMLPNTEFFEFNSNAVGNTLGVWVTTPPGYDPSGSEHYPAIFTPDGNLSAPILIPFVALLGGGATGGDLINPIRPFIQVTVGYSGQQDSNWRFRDLLPPGEPIPPYVTDAIDSFVVAGTGLRNMLRRALQRPATLMPTPFYGS